MRGHVVCQEMIHELARICFFSVLGAGWLIMNIPCQKLFEVRSELHITASHELITEIRTFADEQPAGGRTSGPVVNVVVAQGDPIDAFWLWSVTASKGVVPFAEDVELTCATRH